MEKFEMLEKLQDAGIDVAEELVRAMGDMQAEELLGYVARMWDIDFEEEEEEEDGHFWLALWLSKLFSFFFSAGFPPNEPTTRRI